MQGLASHQFSAEIPDPVVGLRQLTVAWHSQRACFLVHYKWYAMCPKNRHYTTYIPAWSGAVSTPGIRPVSEPQQGSSPRPALLQL